MAIAAKLPRVFIPASLDLNCQGSVGVHMTLTPVMGFPSLSDFRLFQNETKRPSRSLGGQGRGFRLRDGDAYARSHPG